MATKWLMGRTKLSIDAKTLKILIRHFKTSNQLYSAFLLFSYFYLETTNINLVKRSI